MGNAPLFEFGSEIVTITATNNIDGAVGPLDIFIGGTLNYTSSNVAALDADIYDAITSVLYSGARGSMALGMTLTGTATNTVLASGKLTVQLSISGTSHAGYALGTGLLTIPLALSGTAHSTNIAQSSGLLLDLHLKGRGSRAVIADGSLTINNFNLDGEAYWEPHATGSLELDLSIAGRRFSNTYTCLVMNTQNFAVTEYDYEFNGLVFFNATPVGTTKTGIYELTGTTDNGVDISWNFKTGKIDMEDKQVTRMRYVWLSYQPSGDLVLSVDDGTNVYEYPVNSYDVIDGAVRVKTGKGIRAKYLQFELKNKENETIFLDRMRIFTEPVAKAR